MKHFKFIRNSAPVPFEKWDEIFDRVMVKYHQVKEDSNKDTVDGIPFYMFNYHKDADKEMEPWYNKMAKLTKGNLQEGGYYPYKEKITEDMIIDLDVVLNRLNDYLLGIGKPEAYLSDEPEG